MTLDVIAITGLGGMGQACARRLGAGYQLLLADINAESLDKFAEELRADGFSVETQVVDVSDAASVATFAQRAADLGFVRVLLHTAGISQSMADSHRIYAVDLVGAANVIDAFAEHMNAGSVAVFIASMACQVYSFDAAIQNQLATLPTVQLLDAVLNYAVDDSQMAYALAKRGNQLRVEESAVAWGRRGARIVSVSPGAISTPILRLEQQSEHVSELIKLTPMQRIGTAEDVAGAVQWIVNPATNYLTGVDIRIDGGLVAAMRSADLIAR